MDYNKHHHPEKGKFIADKRVERRKKVNRYILIGFFYNVLLFKLNNTIFSTINILSNDTKAHTDKNEIKKCLNISLQQF